MPTTEPSVRPYRLLVWREAKARWVDLSRIGLVYTARDEQAARLRALQANGPLLRHIERWKVEAM